MKAQPLIFYHPLKITSSFPKARLLMTTRTKFPRAQLYVLKKLLTTQARNVFTAIDFLTLKPKNAKNVKGTTTTIERLIDAKCDKPQCPILMLEKQPWLFLSIRA